jgi:hypothetical protein
MIQRGEKTEMGIRICVENRDVESRFREVMPRPEPGCCRATTVCSLDRKRTDD